MVRSIPGTWCVALCHSVTMRCAKKYFPKQEAPGPLFHQAATSVEMTGKVDVPVHFNSHFGRYRHRVQLVRPGLEENLLRAFRRRCRFNHRLVQLVWFWFNQREKASATTNRGISGAKQVRTYEQGPICCYLSTET